MVKAFLKYLTVIVLYITLGVMIGVGALYVKQKYPEQIKHPFVYYVFYQIKHTAGISAKDIKLVIQEDDDAINAYADSHEKVVYLPQGMIDFIGRNTDSLALVLSHEVSHIILEHNAVECYYAATDRTYCEKQADAFGKDIMERLGSYSSCKGAELFLRFERLWPMAEASSHPLHKDRYEFLCKRDI